MEAVPRMPMIALELKIAVDFPFVDAVKQYIFGHYGEEPDKYNEELRKFEQLRSSAVAVTRDFEGCSTLRKYFGQLHYLQSRVPMGEGQDAAVTVIWKDIFTGKAVKYDDIHFEQAAILYNLGALHSLLGVMDSRQSEEGMKVSCTHFQCAAGAFTYLRDHFSHSYSADTSLGILNLYITLMLGQAQECLLEKSMLDNRKSFLIARISAQVAEYYKEACHFLENHEVSSLLGREQKEWKKQIQVKISYFSCIANLYMGKQADEQQKYGERLAFYQSALDKLNEAVKCAKGQQDPTFNEALQFTMDVVGGKYNSAKKDNDFIYHESVPSLDNLPAVKGAPLVKALPFQPTDPSVTGPDILARLVPMEAHKDSSLYSEEKAKMLREVGEKIEEKNKELQHFMDSLGIELEQLERPPAYDRIPQALMEKCAALSVRPDAIKGIVQAMQTLSSVFTDVEASLKEIEDQLEEDEKSENICQEVIGPRPLSNIIKEMSKEWGKYMEAHQKASVTNMELRKAMNLHISNLRLMSGPLDQLRAALPIPTTTTADETVGDNLKKMLRKVGEMREQRTTLEQQIRDMVQGDDITGVLVTAAPGSVRELFTKEMKKYDQLKVYIDQNLSAQENILRALTDANAKYALVRKASEEADDKWNNAVQALVSSYDAYEDLIKKSEEGIHFYKDLEGKVTKLLQRAKSVCRVQDEERQKILERESKKKPPPRPTAPKPPMREPDKPDFGIPPDTGGDIDMSDLPEDLKSLPPDVLRLIMADTALEEASLPRLNSAHRYANYAHPPFHHTSPRHTPQVPGPRDKAQQRPSAPSPNLPTYPAATGSQMAFSPGYAQPLHPGTPQHFAGPRYDNGPHPTMGSSGSLPSVPPFASPYAGPQAPPVAAGGQSSLPTSLAGGGFAPATSVPYQHGPMQPPARLPAYPYHVPPPYQDAVRHPQYTAPPQGGYPSAPHNQHHPLPQQQPTPGQGGYRQAMPAEAHMAHGAHAPYMQSPLHVSSQPQLVQYGHGTPLPGQFRGSAPLPGTDPYQVLGPAPHCMVAPQHEAHAQPRPAALSAGSQPYPYTVAQPGTGQVNPTDARAIHPAGPLPPHVAPGTLPMGSYAPQHQAAPSGGNFQQGHTYLGPAVQQGQQGPAAYQHVQPSVHNPQGGQFNMPHAQPSNAHPLQHQINPPIPVSSSQTSQPVFYPGSIHPTQVTLSAGISPLMPSTGTSQHAPTQPGVMPHAAQSQVTGGIIHPTLTPTPPISNAQLQAFPPAPGAVLRPTPVPSSPASGMVHPAPTPTPPPIGTLHPTPTPTPPPLGGIVPSTATTAPLPPVSGVPLPSTTPPPANLPQPLGTSQQSAGITSHTAPSHATPSSPNTRPALPGSTTALSGAGGGGSSGTGSSSIQISGTGSHGPYQRQSSATDDLLSTSFDGQQSSLQTRNSQPLLQPTRADMVAKGVKIIERDPFVQQDLLRRLVKETERFKAMVESMESLPDGGGITLLERKWKELQELQEKDVRSFSISIARCYTMKNRNPDFMPFDKNRVVLASGKDDYINASMIEELSAYCPRIIATQAPLATTAADFWLMVYEQKIAIIVMLVSEPELEKQRVLRYFPTEKGQQMAQGIVMVSLTSQKVAPSYTERMFALKLRGQSLTRTVVHLHYHCWPELGLPESTSSLLNFIAEVHGHYLHQRPLHMPIVVHCSSGVGRTGAFCLAYAAVQEVEAGKGLPDLMPLVRRMRQQRKHMIQEKLQLRFCYEVVLRHTEQVLQRHGIYVSGVAAPKHPVTTSQKQAPAPVRQDSQDIVLGGDLSFSSIQATVARLSIKTCPSPPQSSLEPAVATPSTTSSEGNPPHTSTTICTADEVVVDAPLPPANGDIAAAAVCAQEDGPTTIKAVPTPAPSSVAIESTNGGAETARSGEPRSNGVGRQASHAPGIVAAKGAVGDVSGGSTLDLLATLSPEAFTLDGNIKGGRQKITRQSFTHPQAGGGLQAPERPDDPLSKLDALWSLGKK
ncbi:tyrosine-protein phosphatase non-receptor type 23 isoform X2 [Lampetra planeri]